MDITLCKFGGCDREVKSLSLCATHYHQKWRGVPLTPTKDKRTIGWRLDSYTDKNGPGGCWLWTAPIANVGYAQLTVNGRKVGAHRLSYIRHKGEIPKGMFIDHECHVRHCINPDHLRLATNSENMQNLSGTQANNTSGYTGVFYYKNRNFYGAYITHRGKRHYIGYFPTAEAAWEARKSKELELFTHSPLHGSVVG